MPQIPQYNQQFSLPGSGGGRAASADDFGGDVASALSQTGQRLKVQANELERRALQAETDSIYEWSAKARAEYTQRLIDMEREAPLGDPSFTSRFKGDFDKYVNESKNNLVRSEHGTSLFNRISAGLGGDLISRASEFQARSGAAKAKASFEEELNIRENSVAADPSQLNSHLAEMQAQLQDPNGKWSLIPKDLQAQLGNSVKNKLAFMAYQSRVMGAKSDAQLATLEKEISSSETAGLIDADRRFQLLRGIGAQRNSIRVEAERAEAKAIRDAHLKSTAEALRLQVGVLNGKISPADAMAEGYRFLENDMTAPAGAQIIRASIRETREDEKEARKLRVTEAISALGQIQIDSAQGKDVKGQMEAFVSKYGDMPEILSKTIREQIKQGSLNSLRTLTEEFIDLDHKIVSGKATQEDVNHFHELSKNIPEGIRMYMRADSKFSKALKGASELEGIEYRLRNGIPLGSGDRKPFGAFLRQQTQSMLSSDTPQDTVDKYELDAIRTATLVPEYFEDSIRGNGNSSDPARVIAAVNKYESLHRTAPHLADRMENMDRVRAIHAFTSSGFPVDVAIDAVDKRNSTPKEVIASRKQSFDDKDGGFSRKWGENGTGWVGDLDSDQQKIVYEHLDTRVRELYATYGDIDVAVRLAEKAAKMWGETEYSPKGFDYMAPEQAVIHYSQGDWFSKQLSEAIAPHFESVPKEVASKAPSTVDKLQTAMFFSSFGTFGGAASYAYQSGKDYGRRVNLEYSGKTNANTKNPVYLVWYLDKSGRIEYVKNKNGKLLEFSPDYSQSEDYRGKFTGPEREARRREWESAVYSAQYGEEFE